MGTFDVALVDEQPGSSAVKHGADSIAVDAALHAEMVITRVHFADAAGGN